MRPLSAVTAISAIYAISTHKAGKPSGLAANESVSLRNLIGRQSVIALQALRTCGAIDTIGPICAVCSGWPRSPICAGWTGWTSRSSRACCAICSGWTLRAFRAICSGRSGRARCSGGPRSAVNAINAVNAILTISAVSTVSAYKARQPFCLSTHKAIRQGDLIGGQSIDARYGVNIEPRIVQISVTCLAQYLPRGAANRQPCSHRPINAP